MFGCVNLLRYVQVRFGVVLACLEYMIANRGNYEDSLGWQFT